MKSYPCDSKRDHDHEMGSNNEPEVHQGIPAEGIDDVRPTYSMVPRPDDTRLDDDESENGHV